MSKARRRYPRRYQPTHAKSDVAAYISKFTQRFDAVSACITYVNCLNDWLWNHSNIQHRPRLLDTLNHFIRMPTELQCHSPKIDGASNRYISWFVDWCTIADFFPFSRKPVSIYRYLWCDVFRLPDEQLWVRDWFYYTARPLLI